MSHEEVDETLHLIHLKETKDQQAESRSTEVTDESQVDDQDNLRSSTNTWGEPVCFLLCVVVVLKDVVSIGAVQSLHQSVPHAELQLGRFIIVPFILLPFVLRRRCDLRVKGDRVKWLVVAAMVVYAENLFNYGCFYYLPLGNASCITHSFRVAILTLGSLILRDWTVDGMCGSLLSVASLVLVTQPEFIFGAKESTNVTSSCFSLCAVDAGLPSSMNGNDSLEISCNDLLEGNGRFDMFKNNNSNMIVASSPVTTMVGVADLELEGYFMAIGAGTATALVCLMFNRPLRDVDPVVIAFWTSILAIVTATGQMLLTETPQLPDCWFCLLMFALHAFLIGAGSGLWIVLNQKTKSPLVVAISLVSMELPLCFLAQYTLFSSMYPGHRNWSEYLGIALCFVGLLLRPVYQLWHRNRKDVSNEMERNVESNSKQ